jgi:hypothetical protein
MQLEPGTGFLPGTHDVPVGGLARVFVKYDLGSNTGARCRLESVAIGAAAAPAGLLDIPDVDPNGNYVFVTGTAAGTATLTVISRDARTRCLTQADLTRDVDCGQSFMVINVV